MVGRWGRLGGRAAGWEAAAALVAAGAAGLAGAAGAGACATACCALGDGVLRTMSVALLLNAGGDPVSDASGRVVLVHPRGELHAGPASA